MVVHWLEVGFRLGGKAEFRRWLKDFQTKYQPSLLRRAQVSMKKFDSIDGN
jgi:hypothetical protein